MKKYNFEILVKPRRLNVPFINITQTYTYVGSNVYSLMNSPNFVEIQIDKENNAIMISPSTKGYTIKGRKGTKFLVKMSREMPMGRYILNEQHSSDGHYIFNLLVQ